MRSCCGQQARPFLVECSTSAMRLLSASSRTKLRKSSSAPLSSVLEARPASSAARPVGSGGSGAARPRHRGRRRSRRTASGRRRGASSPARRRGAPGRRCGERPPRRLVLRHQALDVELLDRLVDQAPLVLGVEHLAGDLLGGEERQLDDVAADLLQDPPVLGLDLLLVLLEASAGPRRLSCEPVRRGPEPGGGTRRGCARGRASPLPAPSA